MALSNHFLLAIKHIVAAAKQGTSQYAFRGTTSLVLQGLDMGLQDIDILANQETAYSIDRGLAEFVVSPLKYSESAQHKSYFGQYKIGDIPIEIMGDWQIKSAGDWSELFDARPSQITFINSLPLTTIATELRCYVFMKRWSVIHKIKRQLV